MIGVFDMSFLGRPTPPYMACLFFIAMGVSISIPNYLEGNKTIAFAALGFFFSLVIIVLGLWWKGLSA